MALVVKSLPANAGDDPPEEGMAPYSSIPAWRIPWTEEPGSSRGPTDSDTTEATPHARVFDGLDPAALGGVSAGPAGKETVSRSVPASESPSSIRENALFKKKPKEKQNKQVNRTS